MDDREARFEQLFPHVGPPSFDLLCSGRACWRHDGISVSPHQVDDPKFRRRVCAKWVAQGWIVREGKPICPDCAKGRNPDRSMFGWNVRRRGIPARLRPAATPAGDRGEPGAGVEEPDSASTRGA